MSQHVKSSRIVRTIINWIAQSEKEGHDVPITQARHWREALLIAIDGLEQRETACFLAEDDPLNPKTGDRFSAVEAEFMTASGTALIASLAMKAVKGAPAEAKDIDRMAVALVDLFDSLARGVARPDVPSQTQEGA